MIGWYNTLGTRLVGATTITRAITDGDISRVVLPTYETISQPLYVGFTAIGNAYLVAPAAERFFLYTLAYDALIMSGIVGTPYVTPDIYGIAYALTIVRNGTEYNDVTTRYTAPGVPQDVIDPREAQTSNQRALGASVVYAGSNLRVNDKNVAFTLDVDRVQTGVDTAFAQLQTALDERVETVHLDAQTVTVATAGRFDGTLSVAGAATMATSLSVGGAAHVAGALAAASLSTGAAVVASTLSVAGAVTLASTLSVTGALAAASLSTNGAITSLSTLSVAGALTMGGGTSTSTSLSLAGGAVVGGTLSVAGDATVTGAVALLSTLSVTGALTAASLSTGAAVTGALTAASLSINGAITGLSTLSVAGALTMGGGTSTSTSLSLAGGAVVGGALSVAGAVALLSTLSVTGALASASLSTGAAVTGALAAASLSTNGAITGLSTLSVAGALTMGGGTSTSTSLSLAGAAVVGGALSVAGAVALLSTLSAGDTGITGALSVTGAMTLGESTTATALTILANVSTGNSLSLGGGILACGALVAASLSTGAVVASSLSVSGALAAASLSVGGTTVIDGTFSVAGAVALAGAVAVAGPLTLAGNDVATKAYVDTVRQSILGDASLPAALDTLSEIATALQGDAGFGVTVTQRITEANVRLNSLLAGTRALPKLSVGGNAAVYGTLRVGTIADVEAKLSALDYLPLTGGTVTGAVTLGVAETPVALTMPATVSTGTSLSLGGGVVVKGALSVAGAVALAGALEVTGPLTLAGNDVATKAYVDTVKQSILGDASLPAALDTLSEIATALQGDAGFGVTVTQRITEANVRLNSLLAGTRALPTLSVGGNAAVYGTLRVGTIADVEAKLSALDYLPLTGGTVTGAVAVTGPLTLAGNDVATKAYVDTVKQSILGDASLPAALDTLSEIATALQGDAGFAVTVTQRITEANVRLNSLLAGTRTLPTLSVGGNAAVYGKLRVGTIADVEAKLSALDYLPLVGGTVTGAVAVGSTLSVRGAMTVGEATSATALTILANVSTGNSLSLGGGILARGALAAASLSTGAVMAASLSVTGALSTGPAVVTMLSTTGALTVNMSSTGTSLSLGGIARVGGALSVTGTSTLVGAVTVGVAATPVLLTMPATASTVTSLSLGGGAVVKGMLSVAGVVNVATLSTTTSLTLGGDAIVGGALSVAGALVVGGEQIQQSTGLMWNSVTKRLGVNMVTPPARTLDIVGDCGVSGTLDVSGGAIVGGTLSVVGPLTLGGSTVATLTDVENVRASILGDASLPAALDTLAEIAAALQGDAGFGVTVTQRIDEANVRLNSLLAGTRALPTLSVGGNAAVYGTLRVGTIADVEAKLSALDYLPLTGGTVTGAVTLGVAETPVTLTMPATVSTDTSLSIGGGVVVKGALSVAGAVALAGALEVTGPLTLAGNDVATKAYVDTVKQSILGDASLPAALDTLSEIATALQGDAGFGVLVSSRITEANVRLNSLLAGTRALPTLSVSGNAAVYGTLRVGTIADVEAKLSALDYLPLTGGTVTGAVAMGSTLSVAGAVTLGVASNPVTLTMPATVSTGNSLSLGGGILALGAVTTSRLSCSGDATVGALTVAGSLLRVSNGLFWKGTTSRLGVNTMAPSYPLEVIGDAGVTGALSVSGASVLRGAMTLGESTNATALTILANVSTGNSLSLGGGILARGALTAASLSTGAMTASSLSTTGALTVTMVSTGTSLSVGGGAVVGGTLSVTGAVALAGALAVAGPLTIAGNDVATKAYVDAAKASILGDASLPAALDTLSEIATALQGDAGFGVLVTNRIDEANVRLNSLLAGTLALPTLSVSGNAAVYGKLRVGTIADVEAHLSSSLNYLPLAGGTVTGAAAFGSTLSVTGALAAASLSTGAAVVSSLSTTGALTVTMVSTGTSLSLGGNAVISGALSVAGALSSSSASVGTLTMNGLLVRSSAGLYWTTDTSRLGVNTVAPAYSLHVTGTAGVTQTLSVGGVATFTGTSVAFPSLASVTYGGATLASTLDARAPVSKILTIGVASAAASVTFDTAEPDVNYQVCVTSSPGICAGVSSRSTTGFAFGALRVSDATSVDMSSTTMRFDVIVVRAGKMIASASLN